MLPLEQQLTELLQFVYLMPVAIIKLAQDGSVQMLNPAAVQLLNEIRLGTSECDGIQIMDTLSPGLSKLWAASSGTIGPITNSLHSELCLREGGRLNFLIRVVRPDRDCTMISIEDVTATVDQERELQRSRQQLGFVLEQIEGYCVAVLDTEGSLAEWNPSINRMLMNDARKLLGTPLRELLADSDQAMQFPTFPEIEDIVRRHGSFRCEAPLKRNCDKQFWGELIVTPTIDLGGATCGYVVVIRDVSAHYDAQQRLLNEAMTDPLTGLLNRRGLALSLGKLTRVSPSTNTLASWIMLDIDHFKVVNDTFGHDVGDLVLKQIASLLKTCSREGDIVARLGGEEFVVVLPGVPISAAIAAAERLRSRLQALELRGCPQPLSITASFGVCAQTREVQWSAALRSADEALYEAKSSGRNKVSTASASVAATPLDQ